MRSSNRYGPVGRRAAGTASGAATGIRPCCRTTNGPSGDGAATSTCWPAGSTTDAPGPTVNNATIVHSLSTIDSYRALPVTVIGAVSADEPGDAAGGRDGA